MTQGCGSQQGDESCKLHRVDRGIIARMVDDLLDLSIKYQVWEEYEDHSRVLYSPSLYLPAF